MVRISWRDLCVICRAANRFDHGTHVYSVQSTRATMAAILQTEKARGPTAGGVESPWTGCGYLTAAGFEARATDLQHRNPIGGAVDARLPGTSEGQNRPTAARNLLLESPSFASEGKRKSSFGSDAGTGEIADRIRLAAVDQVSEMKGSLNRIAAFRHSDWLGLASPANADVRRVGLMSLIYMKVTPN